MPDSALIFAKELDGNGGAIEHTDLEKISQSNHPLWFHFDANHPDSESTVHHTFPDIDEYSVRAIFDQDARPRMLELENGVLIILRGINHNEGGQAEDMVAVRLWITETRIISLRYRKSKAVMEVADSFNQKHGPKTIGDTFAAISSRLFNYIENGIDKLDEKIGLLESRILDKPDRQLRHDISEIRKSAILLRRYIAPQKEAINQLRYAEVVWLTGKNLRRLQEAQDILMRGIEELDAIRERSQVVKDELVNALSDQLNRNLYVLSVITAVFLPLGFLTGLFGINIGGMPGVDNNIAFSYFVASLVTVVIIQVILFKFFKWF
ncbi:zinc transporter ZntB [Teredinibacter purpureus]|uniref:zinc transporter ZntB n=1 Tax=Teredinibacter purpureus TaxID=2731756 RepID=UPI0005F775A5|nr:zinc transporter ZntB [Teredinibacter purpureus]